jgi:type II secretory pathway pseudopilin PulG
MESLFPTCNRRMNMYVSLFRRPHGFTYLGLLILIAVLGITSTVSLQVGSILQRRAAEEELLQIGTEFRNALISYANATPVGQKRAPANLQELLKDPRYPNPRRHLRKLYPDPLTGKPEWGIVEAPNGSGIVGVYSLSNARAIKIGGFDTPFQTFSGKTSYRDWIFTADVQALNPPVANASYRPAP